LEDQILYKCALLTPYGAIVMTCTAHNESLKKEVQRLLQIFNQQNQPQQQIQVVQHRPLSPNTYEITQQQFSNLFSSGGTAKNSSGLSTSLFASGPVSSSQLRSTSNVIRPPSHSVKGVVSSSCMVPSNGKNLEGRMMGGSGTIPSDFMVHNS
jgi:hypothetical protein